MSKPTLTELLESIENAKKDNRKRVADIVFGCKNYMDSLINYVFETDNQLSIKAAWVLEWICTYKGVENLYIYLDQFTDNIALLKFDSAIRPCAKICEQIAIANNSKEKNSPLKKLTNRHKEKLIEIGFDWLITPQKTAVKVYIMNMLFLFGTEEHWINNELDYLIRTKIIHESKGCKARGNHVLKAIEKHRKSHL